MFPIILFLQERRGRARGKDTEATAPPPHLPNSHTASRYLSCPKAIQGQGADSWQPLPVSQSFNTIHVSLPCTILLSSSSCPTIQYNHWVKLSLPAKSAVSPCGPIRHVAGSPLWKLSGISFSLAGLSSQFHPLVASINWSPYGYIL